MKVRNDSPERVTVLVPSWEQIGPCRARGRTLVSLAPGETRTFRARRGERALVLGDHCVFLDRSARHWTLVVE